jgi:hypothetical protein
VVAAVSKFAVGTDVALELGGMVVEVAGKQAESRTEPARRTVNIRKIDLERVFAGIFIHPFISSL